MADTPEATTGAPIRWQRVFVLDDNMLAADRNKLTTALNQIEQSEVGQQKFAQALRLQSSIPADAFTSMHREQTPDGSLVLTSIGADTTRGSEDKRVVIGTLDARDADTDYVKEFILTKGGGGAAPNNLILLHLPTIETNPLPKTLPDGSLALQPSPLSVALIHEFQHTLDQQDSGWGSKTPLPLRPCQEERAIATENTFLKEAFPNDPFRTSYLAPEHDLQRVMAQDKEYQTKTGTDKPFFDKDNIPLFIETFKDQAIMNAGCKAISQTDAVQQARDILIRAGVTPEQLPSPTAAKESAPAQPDAPASGVPASLGAPSEPKSR